MPRFNVPLPDGRWRIFSSVVDDFVSEPMTFDELKQYRREEYGGKAPTEEIDRETSSLLDDRPMVNRMSYEDALEIIEMVHGIELRCSKCGYVGRSEEDGFAFFGEDGQRIDLYDLRYRPEEMAKAMRESKYKACYECRQALKEVVKQVAAEARRKFFDGILKEGK